jgi:hypothetical protein
MISPVTLSPDELDQVIQRVAPAGKEFGAARICRMLADEHGIQTVRVNIRCSIGNISDIVSKCVNPKIKDLGLYVSCVKPPYKINNKFGQPSGQMLWSFYREAANDAEHNPESLSDALRRDLSALKDEYPECYPPSLNETAEGWEEVLRGAGDAEC